MASLRAGSVVCSVLALWIGGTSCGGDPDPSADDARTAGTGGEAAASVGADAGEGGGAGRGSGGTKLSFGGRAEGGRADDPACARATAAAEPVPANFLFVLDTSGSMNCNPPEGDTELAERCARFPQKDDPSRPSKWEVTKSALLDALDTLTAKPQVSAGLMLFPHATECGVSAEPAVPIAPLNEAQLATLADAMDAVVPEGETPVAGATILSYAHLADRLRAGTLSGNSFVVLLTDGAETCAPDVLPKLVDKDVPNARGFDIRTFVIGAPGSESARPLLSEVAWRGGAATSEACEHDLDSDGGDCHFDMTTTEDFAVELGRALDAIAGDRALSCEIEVPENSDGRGVDLDRVNVSFTPEGGEPEAIGNDTAPCEEADGWQYSADFTKIILCGDACRRVRDSAGELSVVLGCPTIRVR